MPAGAGRPWSALLVPGQPVELPRLGGAALRLTLAAIVGAEGESGQDGGAVLSVILPGRRGTGECSFALARIRAAPGAGAHPVAHVRALVGCGKGARLVAVGGSVVVAGRIEAGVLRQAGAPGPAGSAGAAGAAPSAAEPAPAPREGAAAAQAPRPRTEEERLDLVEEHLRKRGRTPLRALGNAVPAPRRARGLKAALLQQRWRFLVDLQGCVDLNRARRWRWRSQPTASGALQAAAAAAERRGGAAAVRGGRAADGPEWQKAQRGLPGLPHCWRKRVCARAARATEASFSRVAAARERKNVIHRASRSAAGGCKPERLGAATLTATAS
ncbi:unnamed protein product [Prorocentrum cordatum]|uniref:Uncharacterized protein n=1 Tax=Prorocentrum cordatum TaxID=2364126 RepID=A0ABN9PZR7_9DINO|nr:unnamed protein product [Polarella glacialis]